MHHKLIASRLMHIVGESSRMPQSKMPDADSSTSTSHANANQESSSSSASSSSTSSLAQSTQHVPLSSDLSKIIDMELCSKADNSSQKKPKAKEGKSEKKQKEPSKKKPKPSKKRKAPAETNNTAADAKPTTKRSKQITPKAAPPSPDAPVQKAPKTPPNSSLSVPPRAEQEAMRHASTALAASMPMTNASLNSHSEDSLATSRNGHLAALLLQQQQQDQQNLLASRLLAQRQFANFHASQQHQHHASLHQLEQLMQFRQAMEAQMLYSNAAAASATPSQTLLAEVLLRQHQQQQLLQRHVAVPPSTASLFSDTNAALENRPFSSVAQPPAPSSSEAATSEEKQSPTKTVAKPSAKSKKVTSPKPKKTAPKKPVLESASLSSGSSDAGNGSVASGGHEDHESHDEDELDENGNRFRPYQYEQWTEKFQELVNFRKRKGHCQVPHTYKENPPLARWVKRQRYQYKLKAESKQSTMTDERIKLLEDVGFIWDSHAAAWAEKLAELEEYRQLQGDCNVPSTFPENPQLATWVKCQRRQYKLLRDGKTSNMTPERINQLETLGFVWELRKTWDLKRPPSFTDSNSGVLNKSSKKASTNELTARRAEISATS